jgi:membrane-bound lytic murein transglycosylase D
VVVKEPMSFDQLSQALDVSTEEILYFNPQYRKNVIPSGGYAMCLSKTKIGMFLSNEQAIYAAIEAQKKEGATAEVLAEVKRTHTVRSGEKLSTIARKYGVTVADLKTWNYVGKRGIRPGKKLVVYVREQKAAPAKLEVKNEKNLAANTQVDNKQLAENREPSPEYIFHKVRKGETLGGIARKYNSSIQELRELNDIGGKGLRYDQTLKIRAQN